MHTNSSLECRQVLYIACTKQALNMVHVNKDKANLSCTSQYPPIFILCTTYLFRRKKKKKILDVYLVQMYRNSALECCMKTQNKTH